MKRPHHYLAQTTAVFLGAVAPTLAAANELLTVPLPGSVPKIASSFSRQPLVFEPNVGQTDAEVEFLARGPGYQLFLMATEAVMVLNSAAPDKSTKSCTDRAQWQGADALWDGFGSGGVGEFSGLPSTFESGAAAPHSKTLPRGSDALGSGESSPGLCNPRALRMRLVNAKALSSVEGDAELRGKVNYFIGNDPNRWRTNIPTFAKVHYREVYPGTDLVYYGNQEGRLEYDFVLAPGADPELIALEFEGADRLELNESGDLVAWIGGRPVRWQKPVVYQEFDGRRTEIAGAYRLNDGALAFRANPSHRIGFALAAYDRSQPLVIDPVLVYSTYLGGAQSDSAAAITTDAQGNAIVVGSTGSINFPTRSALDPEIEGGSDAFVAKLSSSGELLYASYLGGASYDWAIGVQLDRAGNIHLAGGTGSKNYPVVKPLQAAHGGGGPDSGNAFITILTPDGTGISFSSYWGGAKACYLYALALDPSGNIYLGGYTDGDFPTVNAFQPVPSTSGDGFIREGFITKLAAGGKTVIYSTYLGGSEPDFVEGIAADAEGHAYVVAYTSSFDLPIKDAPQPFFAGKTDFFYAKFLPDGSDLVYGSYFGGDDYDAQGVGMALGPNGTLWIAGQCNSRGLATAGAFQPDFSIYPVSILARFSATNGSLEAATYFDSAYAESIAVDAAGDVWIGGSASEGLTLVNPIQPNYGGSGTNWAQVADGYVAKFSSDCSSLLFSTYFGGAGIDENISSLAVDPKGDIIFVGKAGNSEGFPIVNAFQPEHGGGGDALVAKISLREVLRVSRFGQTLELSWPASAAGFVLESATTLANGGDWQNFPTAPAEINGQKVNTVGTTNAAGFFRLRKQ